MDNFEKAGKATYKDQALSAYLYYYKNLCALDQEGVGDMELVSSAMKEASKYMPLAKG